MNEINISPIFYMGNKRKLIKKGLINLFPQQIDTFYDLFGGSGIVSMNTKAKEYNLNDLNKNVFDFYLMFKDKQSDFIIDQIKANILEFGMIRQGVKQNSEYSSLYKNKYYNLRKKANETREVIDLYSCMFYAFSQQMRFNKSGEFNMPFGNGAFTETNEEYIIKGCEFFSNPNLKINNNNYLEFVNFNNDDFVYLDPPYLNTTATYTENNAWNKVDEQNLYDYILKLDRNNIKFGMSNVLSSKKSKNIGLKRFCFNNNFKIHHFDKFSYQTCGKVNKVDEVFITNYEV